MNLLNPYRGLPREVYIIFISQTINALGALIFPFMTLLLSRKIGFSPDATGLTISLLGLTMAPASLIGGKLADSFGRKKILITFELIAAAAYLSCIFIPPSMTLVIVLGFASFCFGLAGPSHGAMIADLTEEGNREGAYSLLYLGFNLGFAFAQIFAGMLFEEHLNFMFLIDAGTALMSIALIGFLVKDHYVPLSNRTGVSPSVAETAGGESSDANPADKSDEASRDAGSLPRDAVSAPAGDESRDSVLKVLFRRPVLLFFALAALGYRFVYSQWGFMIPLQAEANFPGGGAQLYGFLGSFNASIVVIMTPVLTALLSRRSNLQKIILAGILFTIGFGMLGYYSVRTAFFISVLIFTLGEISEAISVMPFIMNHTPSTHRGRMSSVVQLIMGAGFFLGPLIMGSVLEKTSFRFSWTLIAGVMIVATLGMLALSRMEKNYRVTPDEIGNAGEPAGPV